MQMKFAVVVVGTLEIGRCPGGIETPALLLSTRKGLPHFISPFPSFPSPSCFSTPLDLLQPLSKLGGLHQMLGLHHYGIAAVPRDSIQCLPEFRGATKLGPSFETPCGRLLIKPKDYVEMISYMRPNIWATFADEVPAWVSDKRNKSSVDRTVRWLDDCLALNPAAGSIFGAIVGGPNLDERKRCAEEVAKRNVSAFVAASFLTFDHTSKWVAYVVASMGLFPILMFLVLQFSLFDGLLDYFFWSRYYRLSKLQ